MARIGWIPFQKQISQILEKTQNIDYNIKYDLPFGFSNYPRLCPFLHQYQSSVDFDFSSLTIKFSLDWQLYLCCFFTVCTCCCSTGSVW